MSMRECFCSHWREILYRRAHNDSLGLGSSFGSAQEENEYHSATEGNLWLDEQNRRIRAFYRQVATRPRYDRVEEVFRDFTKVH